MLKYAAFALTKTLCFIFFTLKYLTQIQSSKNVNLCIES